MTWLCRYIVEKGCCKKYIRQELFHDDFYDDEKRSEIGTMMMGNGCQDIITRHHNVLLNEFIATSVPFL